MIYYNSRRNIFGLTSDGVLLETGSVGVFLVLTNEWVLVGEL